LPGRRPALRGQCQDAPPPFWAHWRGLMMGNETFMAHLRMVLKCRRFQFNPPRARPGRERHI
jgi:hypothetical protein